MALRIAKWIGIALLAVIALAGLAVIGINTAPGRQFVARQISAYQLESGLKFEVGRLDGSLYGNLIIRDLRVRDTRGVFATAPEIRLDWRPFAYVRNHVDIRSVSAPLVRLARLPTLKPLPSDPNAPTLPDLDIDIGRLRVARLILDPPVTGTSQTMSIDAATRIADRRLLLSGNVRSTKGDRLAVRIDAVPDDNRLTIDANLAAPRGGLVATLAKVNAPIAASIGGRGSWRDWRGAVDATLGNQPIARLALTARSGTFTLRGPTRPGLVLGGPAIRLTAPALFVDATAAVADRRADTRISLRSDALQVRANGLLDLAKSRFERVRVDGTLMQPGSIADNLNGRDIRLALLLDGPFARPLVDYNVTAGAIGFGATVVEGLRANGRARVNADNIQVPISARARRVTGLNAAAGGLLTNVAIDGDLALSGDTALSDNLRIRSDRINATAVVVADLSTGIYRGALKGRVNDYAVDGIGIINLTTDVNLVTVPAGGFGLTGRIAAQTVRITNESAREFLGGRTIVSADVSFNPQGVADIRNLRLVAPQFRITSGAGTYRSDGRIAFQGSALSSQYGPVTVGVTGTAEQPLVRLRAARPGLGVGLASVDATIRGTGSGYAIQAVGGSDYGPFSADVFVRAGRGPLAVDINRARFAEIDFAGRVGQSSAGPFTGRVTANGRGLSGVIRLAAQGKVQRADVNATARGARVPGATPITIDRAIITATAILYPNAPSIVGDAQVAGVRQGSLIVQTARAKINYRGGRGTAQLVAAGQSGARLNIAANAQLSPGLYRVALQGQANNIAFRLAEPASIRIAQGNYTLAPATIVLPQGRVQVSGRYGRGLAVQSRFDDFDLSIVNAFAAGTGIGGRASGNLDFVQGAGGGTPTADIRLQIANFTRAGAASVSTPVNIAALAQLRLSGGTADALVRRGGAVIGRVQARLQPLGGGGSWSERLFAAPLSGGIRYNGPAEVLSSLAGLANQQISGPIGIAADFGGRLSQPQLNGVIRANDLTYDNDTYGTRIRAIRLSGRFTNDRLEITQLTGRAGDGTIEAQGRVGFASDSGFPIDIRVALADAQLARSDALGATISGNVAVTNDRTNGAVVSGDLRLPEVRYEVIRQGAAEVAELTGVRRRGTTLAAAREEAEAGPPGLFKLDLRVRADRRVFVSGMGLEAEWSTDLRVGGTSAAPIVTGQVNLVRGTYSFAGRRFDLDTSSNINFRGGKLIDPLLDISANTTVNGVTATIDIGGTAQRPQITFGSTPTLPQDEILSRLLFGTSVTSLSATQALQLASALNSLRGSGGGLNPLGKLRSATGIDRLRILGADQSTGRGTAIAAGQYISNNIYVEIITDARGFTATQLEISLSKALRLLSQAGGSGGTNAAIQYTRDY